jgi:hypothetical protein
MKSIQLLARAAALSALLISLTPTFSPAQGIERGYDGDQAVTSGQRDTEDHETSLDWVGLFGLLGLVGLVGPKHKRVQRRMMARKAVAITTIVVAGAALSMATPALSLAQQEDEKGYSIESSQQGKGDRPASIGWIGLLGLAGLLGLGLPKWGKHKGDESGSGTR